MPKKWENDEDIPFWRKRRYTIVLMVLLGFCNIYTLRVNLSVAVVAMNEVRNVTLTNGTTVEEREFNWSSKERGLVLSSFFYGYITTQLLGGFLANKVGGHIIFGAGIMVTAVLTLITPLAAKTDFYFLIALRIVEGVFEGLTLPCSHDIWSRWAPPKERTQMTTLGYVGQHVGTLLAMSISGRLSQDCGWESVFYFFGAVACVWYFSWLWVVRRGPKQDPRCSQAEREYIMSSLGHDSGKMQKIDHPWKEIFTSKPVWAISVSFFAENWGFYTMLTQLPTFLKDVLDYDLTNSGIVSSLPYVAMAAMMIVAGWLADWVQVKGYLTTIQVRKYFNCGSFLAQTVFMLAASIWLHKIGTVVCIIIAIGLGGFAWTGFSVNALDIAPNHASVIMGIATTCATIPGVVSPLLTGAIVKDKDPEQWKIVFYISAGIYLIGSFVYWFWASADKQPWAVDSKAVAPKPSAKGHKNPAFDVSDEKFDKYDRQR